ncbi:MAG: DUF4982 domain-containing protein [Defluviitaleaceae bacterium]|nr:DUF4982 domain-containing protein [Defluviitaleaceae bacterium]
MENFNANWSFTLDGKTKPVTLPHDWLIADTKNLYKHGIATYKKTFSPSPAPRDGEKIFLHFDGVYQDCTLEVNGKKVGDNKHGYTAFYFDIAPFLNPGENEIAVTVRHEPPNSRWYSGAGIYRDVSLERKNATHFTPNGIYVTPKKERDNLWQIEIQAEVSNADKNYEIRHEIHERGQGDCVPLRGCGGSAPAVLSLENPKLWDIDSPTCYTLKSELIVAGEVADTVETRFGFREIAFTPEGGFFLNGRHVRLDGACQHHDLGGLGAAFYKDAARRQLLKLRDMGVNAIRTAHNPPAKEFMELCDEMGFLVMSEFTDIWRRCKTEFDYARFFDEWAEHDVAAWVRRDRNCPSIIMWSIGNEIYDTHADPDDGLATLQMLMREVRRHDPKVHAETTFCSNYMSWWQTQKSADEIKFVGYNYAEYLYDEHREKFPDWIIYGGETASTVQSRGIYHFPYSQIILCDDDMQCSALGNSTTSWGARSTEKVIADHLENMGQFIWTGTDYIGEPTPYSTKNSYFGQIDTAGFPKDQFYYFKAAWTDQPMVHVYPHWDHSPGQPIDVRIISNAPKTELFLNGKSLGTGEKSAHFIVPYEPGCIKAVAYDNAGKIVAEAERNSFGDATGTKIEATRIGELFFAEITATDSSGNTCDNANNRVIVNVTNGELLALDNGDSTDYDQYQGVNNRRLFAGKLLAIVKCVSESEPKITVKFDESDVPARKIELLRDGFNITAKIHPANATPQNLQWRLTNAAGIDSPLGRIEASGNSAKIQAKGDGDVYIRCGAENGKSHIDMLSVLPIKIEGVGKPPHLDPYDFVSAGLFTRSNRPLTAGNERGVATDPTEKTHIIFDDVNFGKFGSDELTLWIFELGNNPIPIEIWLGTPEDGRLISNEIYHIKSIWNTYQTATYKLPEKFCGVQTFTLVFKDKVHVKGFSFKGKTFTPIPFTAYDNLYGDSYNVTADAIENIGNNVSITFDDMNFDKPAVAIEFRYRLRLDKNSIRITFTDENGTSASNLLTLTTSENYSSATFPLETPFSGKGNVNFTFFPGSDIDLETFTFSS